MVAKNPMNGEGGTVADPETIQLRGSSTFRLTLTSNLLCLHLISSSCGVCSRNAENIYVRSSLLLSVTSTLSVAGLIKFGKLPAGTPT